MVERRPDPAEPGFDRRLGGERLHLLAGEPLEDGDVEPAGRGVVGEQVPLDSAAGRDIGLLADQACAAVVGAGGGLGHHPADAVGMRGAVASAHLLEHEGLPLLVGRRGIGLGDVEADLAGAERFEHDGSKRREAQPALDEADGQPEPPGDPLDVGALLDQLLEGEALVGRVHRQPLEILGEARLLGFGGAAFEHQAAHFVRLGQFAFFGQALERAQPPAARLDGETAARLDRAGHDEILE